MNVRRRLESVLALASLVVIGALVAGCGDDVPSSADDTTPAPGSLTHADGTIVVQGDRVMLTPAKGGAAEEYVIGPKVTSGTVQALAASSARARVFYRTGDTDGPAPTAVAIDAAPSAGEDAKTYDGRVTEVSDSSITIDGDDGKRTFDIAEEDRAAFDTAHLEEHQDEKSPVRIYYRGSGDDLNAVAYEDA